MLELINYCVKTCSTWVVISGFVVFYSMLTFVSAWFFERFFPENMLHSSDSTQPAGSLFSVFSGFYAILLAFIIVMLWQDLENNLSFIQDEASHLSQITRLNNTMADAKQPLVTAAVQQYITAITGTEWNAFRTGRNEPQTEAALVALYNSPKNFDLKTDNQRAYYAELIRKMDELVSIHRARVDGITGSTMPDEMLYIILFGGVFIVVLVTQLGGMPRANQYILKLAASMFIAINVGLVFVLNCPYSLNVFSIKPYTEGALQQYATP